MKVLVLGAGKMTESILLGLSGKLVMDDWSIYSPSGISAKTLAEKVKARAVSDLDNILAPEWILIGCKPQQIASIKETLKGRFPNSLYVSMLAAISEEDQLKLLGANTLIRVMPNLAVKYNQGVTLLSSESAAPQVSRIEEIFNLLGEVVKVSEKELEELTLLTGSGPAFFYEFTKLLAEEFTSLSPKEREHLARKVLAGAAVTVNNDLLPLESLTSSVTSKGGVTIAVLENWRSEGMKKLVRNGIAAGMKRAKEIRESILRS